MKKLWVKISGKLEMAGRAVNKKTNKGINFPLLVRHFNAVMILQTAVLRNRYPFYKSNKSLGNRLHVVYLHRHTDGVCFHTYGV